MKKTSQLFAAALALSLSVGLVEAKPSLWSYDRISKGLFDLAVADTIGKRCDTISARKVRGLGVAKGLYDFAVSKGYTRAEVKAFIKSDTEKAKLRSRVVSWLKSEGVDINNNASFCPLGEKEIKKNSQIGRLLASSS